MIEDKPGLLMVWTDIPPEVEPDFNEWYNREHMPDRINKVPGFTRARRFIALAGAPRYLALYETQSTSVFRSEPYLAINRNPDPTSKRFIPLFRNTVKGICDVGLRLGQGEGSFLALMPAGNELTRQKEFRDWVSRSLLPDLVQTRDVVAATFAYANKTIQQTAAASYTRSGDRFADSLIAVEATSETGLAAAAAALNAERMAQRGGTAPIVSQACTFRVIYTQHA